MPEIRMPVGGVTPPTPPTNEVSLYVKADKRFYMQDDAGAEVKLLTDESTLASLTVQLPLTSTGGANPTIAINNATPTTSGAMTFQDKVKLDSSTALNTAGEIVARDGLGNFVANEITATAFNGPASSVITAPALLGDITSDGITNVTTLASNIITNDNIAGGAAIQLSKLAIDPLNRGNHIGTQDAATTLTNLGSAIDTHLSTNAPIVNAMIDNAADIALSKLDTDPLARGNHTGVQPVSTLSDFTTEVNSTITNYLGTNPITNADVSTTANIDLSKLDTDPLDRANHTNTQLAATISDFNTAVDNALIAGDGINITTGTVSAVGTLNRISVAGGTIDIDGSYSGQNSITTLGTVTIGAWQGNVVTVPYGGTGSSNAGTAANNLVAVDTYTTSQNITSTNGYVIADATSSILTMTLPSSATIAKFSFKKIDSSANNVVITAQGGQSIDGNATYSLTSQYDSVTIVSDGTTNWWVI